MSNQGPSRVFTKVNVQTIKMQPTKGPPPYPKVKYSDAKMRDVIPNLPLFECLKIEYQAKGIWFKMISKRGNMYNCECCGVENVCITPICDHVRGKKHRLALQAADKLFHPQYTAPKPSKSPARTPILDAYLSSEGKLNETESSSEQISKPGLASAAQKQKPGPASAQKPGPASAQKPGPASAQKPGTTSAQKPGPVSAQKPGSASAQKPKPKPDSAGAAQQKPLGTQKPGPASSKKPMNATNKPAPPGKTSGVVEQDASSSVSKNTETTDFSESKETTAVESKDKSRVENSENRKSPEATRKQETITEIVVLDDDDDDDSPAQQQSSSNANRSQNDSVGQAIPVAGTAVPKSQRLPRRVLNPQAIVNQQQNAANEAKGSTIPSANRVLNPAAVLAQTAEQRNDENKPQYQQNRVIIPSVNKKRDQLNQKPKGNVQPNFSTKSFSPKISSGELEGIIGVEYVVKILKVYNDPDPFYECCLCEVVMDGIGMQTHLLGYNHRYKYIEKHFPTCFNQYKDHVGNIHVMGVILDRVAHAIEGHHGRELPYECLSGEFRSNRHGVMTTVYSFRHASEYLGPSFTNVVDSKQLDELVKNKTLYKPPKPDPKRKPTFDTRSGAPVAKKVRVERDREPERERPFPPPSSGRGNNGRRGEMGGSSSNRRPYRVEQENNTTTNTLDDATHKLMVEEFLQHTRGRSRSPGGRRRRQKSRSRSPHRSHRRESRRSPSPLREGDIWQAYRHLVDRSKNELDQMYKEYRKDPEKHPVYNEEWRKFWKHRKDQLTREGLDHRGYDFQPEWVRYFAVRIEELYDEAVEDIKINCRRRLILPMTNDELEDKKYHVKKVIAEVEETQKIEQQSNPNQPSFPQPNVNTSVVNVLRLLTALEDYLGSLGPKVVDLLTQALLVEKTNPREINEIILNLENCTILETAMEKLKGVLIAGLLEGPKVRAFNNVILETDKILRIGYKIRQENPQPQMRRPNPQPVPAPKDKQSVFQQKSLSPQRNTGSAGGGNSSGAAASLLSQIDKKELATKLAAALTAQGKTDFNPEQLQQLIAVYSLIDKKKRDSAAASDKQKMTLSDTLTALLNPSSDHKSGDARENSPQPLLSNRMGGGRNYSNSNDTFGPVNNSSVNSLVNILNRDNMSADGSANAGDSEMWQNLQNIQSSLRSQNNLSSNTSGNNSGNIGRGFGNNLLGNDNMSSGGGGGNFNNRGGFGGSSGNDFNSGQNFSSKANRGDDLEAGFRAGFQGMNSNPSRAGGNDNMISGGRGVNDMLNNGSRIRNDSISRGRGGNDMMTGGRGGGGSTSNNNTFSGGITNTGGSNFSRGASAGMRGANNTLGFARTSFLGGGSSSGVGGLTSSFSGLSNFSTSIGLSSGNTFQRSSIGGMGGGGGNSGSNMGRSNFNRGNVTAPSNFGLGNTSANFNNQPNNNNSGGGQTFGSAPNQRNMGGNQGSNSNTQSGRGGSNWRNQ